MLPVRPGLPLRSALNGCGDGSTVPYSRTPHGGSLPSTRRRWAAGRAAGRAAADRGRQRRPGPGRAWGRGRGWHLRLGALQEAAPDPAPSRPRSPGGSQRRAVEQSEAGGPGTAGLGARAGPDRTGEARNGGSGRGAARGGSGAEPPAGRVCEGGGGKLCAGPQGRAAEGRPGG